MIPTSCFFFFRFEYYCVLFINFDVTTKYQVSNVLIVIKKYFLRINFEPNFYIRAKIGTKSFFFNVIEKQKHILYYFY